MSKEYMEKRHSSWRQGEYGKVLNRLKVSVAVGMTSGIILASSFSLMTAQERPQLKRPAQDSEEKPPETKKPKKVKGPRAVGIVQLSDGKATLIPIAILVDGKFYDGSVYKAEPVPMALESGTVYEAEQGGESQGLFTTKGAMHSKAVNSVQWWGTGSYLPNGTEAVKTTHKAEDVPVGLDNSGDEPPRLTRKATTPKSNTSSGAGGASDSPPVTGKDGNAASANSAPASSSDDSKSGERKSSDKGAETSDKTQTPTPPAGEKKNADESSQNPGAENYYRPTLRRGKPTEVVPEEKDPVPRVEALVPGVTQGNKSAKVVQVMAAVSDSGGPQPESYKYFWKEGEEEERRKQMLSLATDELRAYLNLRAKGAIPAVAAQKPVAPKSKGAAKAAPPEFDNVRFAGFDVWRNNQPVMILSADAHLAGGPGGAQGPETYAITLVSRTDIYGSLRKLYAGVTDKFHLDVTPKMELIDVVDADGDGRGELLFRETTDGGSGYVIYRATGDKLWKLFSSRNSE